MIFGLFKKEQTADSVFVNAKVYTQDADMPWAEAVACKDGEIIYIGTSQDTEQFVGPDTYVLDLQGKYMIPGLINTHSHPALRVFQDEYISISENYDIDDVLGMMSDYIVENSDQEVYFGYGFDSQLLKGMTQEEASAKLDEVCKDKPIMLLSICEGVLWVNNFALEQVKSAAEEDGQQMISLDYFLQALAPFDYEVIQNKIIELASDYCSKGFTSIFNAGVPEFMDNIYQDVVIMMHQQDMIKQRYFGSLLVARNIKSEFVLRKLMQKKTKTTELDDFVNCNTLKIMFRREENSEGITGENIKKILISVSERGFNVHIDVFNQKAFKECMENITAVRNAGYRKNNFVIACDEDNRKDSENFSLDEMCLDNVFFQPSTNCEPSNEYGAIEGATTAEEILDRFTIDAAIPLGISDKLGSIEIGKFADFSIFEENPIDVTKPGMFKKLLANMTVVAGTVVYDEEEDSMQEWYDIMSGMQL